MCRFQGATVEDGLDLNNGDTSSIADDGGDGISLREALAATNANAGTDTINFSLAGQVITPGPALPQIIDSVVIDATSSPSYASKPLGVGFAGVGSASPGSDPFFVFS